MSSGASGFLESSAADRVSQNLFKLIEFLGAAPRSSEGQATSEMWPSVQSSGANKSTSSTLQLLKGLLSFLPPPRRKRSKRRMDFPFVVKGENLFQSLPVEQ